MNSSLHAFMNHLHLYGTVAGLLVVLAIAGLIVLYVRYSKPYRAPRGS